MKYNFSVSDLAFKKIQLKRVWIKLQVWFHRKRTVPRENVILRFSLNLPRRIASRIDSRLRYTRHLVHRGRKRGRAAASPRAIELWKLACTGLLRRILTSVVYWPVPYWASVSRCPDSNVLIPVSASSADRKFSIDRWHDRRAKAFKAGSRPERPRRKSRNRGNVPLWKMPV